MMILAFLCGALTALTSIMLAVHIVKYGTQVEATPLPFPSLFARRQKKTPKAVSEEDLWRREQKEAPRDPGL